MLSSTWINCPMSMSLLISIIVSSFYFCYQYTQLFGLPRFYHHNTFFDILQVQHGLTYFHINHNYQGLLKNIITMPS